MYTPPIASPVRKAGRRHRQTNIRRRYGSKLRLTRSAARPTPSRFRCRRRNNTAAFYAPRSRPNTGFGAKPHSIARIQPIARPNPGSGRSPVLFKPVPSHREWRQGHSFQGSCGGMRRDHPSLIVEIRSISAFYVRQVHASLLPMDRISAANHMAAS